MFHYIYNKLYIQNMNTGLQADLNPEADYESKQL